MLGCAPINDINEYMYLVITENVSIKTYED